MVASSTNKQAVVYCRVSTRRQEDEGTSLQTQEEACIRHAQELGYSVAHVTRLLLPWRDG